MSTIYFLSPLDTAPSGGIKQLYRQADLLNRNGYSAAVVHRERGFRHTWFDNRTRVVCGDDLRLAADDFLVLPEVFGTQPFAKGTPKIVFNQNCYRTFANHANGEDVSAIACRDPEVAGAIVVSEDSARYLRHAFPGLAVHRISLGIDPAIFHHDPARKKRKLAFMPRRLPEDIAQVIGILTLRGALADVELVAIDEMSEAQVAAAMSETLVFLSFNSREGFGLPPVEAMSCGCIVVGYAGGGGKEYMLPRFSYPVPDGDVRLFAETVEGVLARHAKDPGPLAEQAAQAREFIRERYSLAREEESAIAAWRALTAGRRPAP